MTIGALYHGIVLQARQASPTIITSQKLCMKTDIYSILFVATILTLSRPSFKL